MFTSQPNASEKTKSFRISAILSSIPVVGSILAFKKSSPLTLCATFALRLCYIMFLSVTIFFLSLLIDKARCECVKSPVTVQERIVTTGNSADCSDPDRSTVKLERATDRKDSAVDFFEDGATKFEGASVDAATKTDRDYEESGLSVITGNLDIPTDTPIPPDSAVSLSPRKFVTDASQSAAELSCTEDVGAVSLCGPPPPPLPPPPPPPQIKRPRCLNWTPIPCVTGSVFDIRERKVVLCESFKERLRREYTPDGSISKPIISFVSESHPSVRMSLLTNDRSRNIEIILRRTTVDNVIDALMTMDTNTLPLSVGSQLTGILHPQPYEIEGAQRMNLTLEQIEKLPRSERYMVKLLRVPDYDQRMSDFVFLSHITETLHEVQHVQRQVAHCTQYLLNNCDLQLVFETILAIGNVLNENTPLAQAQGFHLDILPSLKFKRTVDGRNFNHTLCEVMKEQHGGFGAALVEVKSLCSLKKVSDNQIEELNRQVTSISTRGPGYGDDRFNIRPKSGSTPPGSELITPLINVNHNK